MQKPAPHPVPAPGSLLEMQLAVAAVFAARGDAAGAAWALAPPFFPPQPPAHA